MRSKGIPIAEDFTPQWANRSYNHTWVSLLLNNGNICEYEALWGEPGNPHKMQDLKAKIYRHVYARNKELTNLLQKEKYPPEKFHNVFIKDVTDQYMKVSTVEIPIALNRDVRNGYAYLAIFDNIQWVPLAYGRRDGQRVIFDKVGRNYVYLPVYSTKQGLVPLNYPFRLTYEGKVEFLEPNASSPQTFTLLRKYPVHDWVYNASDRWTDGKLQAANKADFSDAVTFFQIDKYYPSLALRVDTVPPCRYWRYYSAEGGNCYIAELMFFSDEDSTRQVCDEIIGTDGSWGNNKAKTKAAVFDGDPLTHFDAPVQSGGWAGMDFGKPVRLSKIICYPVSDGNMIRFGDTYELCYWDGNSWAVAGRQVARDVRLTFTGVPSGGLYLLNDVTRGKEKRPFTWENTKQKWW
ncbi:MAG: hypothetical protein LBH06_04850 [Rikenellaceae bacterium]|jgi:hypothetical protein|nr:hypothetical protein [Rikenellaceae bacterium]